MDSKKITSYFLYAIGEIVLVVIGILIAVSINNWNQESKNEIRIEDALQHLTKELKEDSVQIDKLLKLHTTRLDKSKNVFQRASSPDATIDTLIHLMTMEFDGYWDKHFAYNQSAYENMVTGGVLELLDDSIKIMITEIYHTYERNKAAMEAQNAQYRVPMNDFFSRYPIMQFYRHEPYISNWRPRDEEDFHPRAEWLVFVHYYMWNNYISSLRQEQKKVNALLSTLEKSYQFL